MNSESVGGLRDFVRSLGAAVGHAVAGETDNPMASAVQAMVEASPLAVVVTNSAGAPVLENRSARELRSQLEDEGLEQWEAVLRGGSCADGPDVSPAFRAEEGSIRLYFKTAGGALRSSDNAWSTVHKTDGSGTCRVTVTTSWAPLIVPVDERFSSNVFDQSPIGIAVMNPVAGAPATVSYANSAFLELTGWSRDELQQLDQASMMERLIPVQSWKTADESRAPGVLVDERVRLTRSEQGPRWVDIRAMQPAGESGNAPVVWFLSDVSSETQFAERYRTLFDRGPAMMFELTQSDGMLWISYLNAQAESWLGDAAADILANDFTEFGNWLDPGQARRWLDDLEASESTVHYFEIDRPDSDTTLVQVAATRVEQGSVTQILGIAHDVTERRRLEEEDARRQRLEALARISGALGHEINNALMVTRGHLELLRSDDDDAATRRIAMATSAIDHAAETATQLMTMARPSPLKGERVLIDEWLTDALRRLKPVLSTGTTLVESLEAPDTAVKIETGRLDQVLLNLLLNANDAAGPDAVVVVRSRLVDGDGPTKTVQIEVEDDGQGIDASVRSTLFEPFVTTKAGKGGTGLGLAVSSQLVESLGGALSYHGYENRGAVFRITLPEFGANLERETSPSDSDAGIGAHVLLVDDQQSVLAVMGEALRTAGFQTMECVDSTSAWKYFEWADVLITDLTMPDVDGVALSERFRRECPGRPVAIVSGFIPEDMALSVADAVLLKPFRLSELVETTAQLAVRGDRGRSDVLESAS